MRNYGLDDIDYHVLIKELSVTPNYPHSLHIRNHLLAPYAANSPPPSDIEQDAWSTYQSYRRGAQVVVFGNVPKHLTISGTLIDGKSVASNSPWGVAIVFPSYAPGWVEIDEGTEMESDIWHGLRVSMWLSSEHRIPLTTSEGDQWEGNAAEVALIDYVFHDFVPKAASRYLNETGKDDSAQEAIVDLFAVNDAWIKMIEAWTEAGTDNVKLTRANPCMMFIKSEEDAAPSIRSSREATLDHLTIQADDVRLVQQSNALCFPLWYTDHRRHISIMLRARNGSREALAWAYAHDDLSMASLHVLPSHRRKGLGQLCVQEMSIKLIRAQKDAIIKAGFDDITLPTPVFLDTEMHKGASRLFFEAQGFRGAAVLTWGSITVSIK